MSTRRYNAAEEIARKLLKKMKGGSHNSGEPINFEVEYFELYGLCEAFLSMERHHRKIKKLIEVCNTIHGTEEWDGYWTKLDNE